MRAYGTSMFYSFRMSGVGRTDCLSDGHQAAEQYPRHVVVDFVPAVGLDKVGVGAWPF